MSVETRTFIELKDIAGVEFACPRCEAKVFYPLVKQYDRLVHQCPNCQENWFIEAEFAAPNVKTVSEQVRAVMASLQNVAKSELVRTRIRLQINDSKKNEDQIERN